MLKNIILKKAKACFIRTISYPAKRIQIPFFLERKANIPYEKKDEQFKICKKAITAKLQEVMDIKKITVMDLLISTPDLNKTSPYMIENNYKLCVTNEIKRKTLLKYPQILCELNLSEKINKLRSFGKDLNEIAVLLTLDDKFLSALVKETDKGVDRIQICSKMFNKSQSEICEHFVKRPFLIFMLLDNLKKNLEIFLSFDFTTDEVLKDPWVLRYTSAYLEKRLQMAKACNVGKLKTWMVRSQSEILEKYKERRSEKQLILGSNSLVEYLSERLDCSEALAKYMISKHPALNNKSLKKMQGIIDFLYAEGFKPQHICRVPKILLHSVETIKKRLKELESQGMKLDSLHILTKSQKQYMQYYEALANKNKLKN